MIIKKNLHVIGSAGRTMLTDVFYSQDGRQKPIVIYAHGFNGFKDWGNFDQIARLFADAGFVFVKFNFSHNGTTVECPEEFEDLEAFGQNNYTKELNDLQSVMNWVQENEQLEVEEIDKEKIFLIGHSRGGGVVILKAAEDSRVSKIATWASVSDFKTPWGSWPDDRMANWEKNGIDYYLNGRTKQKMPLYYQLFQDFDINQLRLNVQQAIASLNIPVLICHGNKDEAVSIEQAQRLLECQPNATFFEVESDHVFERTHPSIKEDLPEAIQSVVNITIKFFLK